MVATATSFFNVHTRRVERRHTILVMTRTARLLTLAPYARQMKLQVVLLFCVICEGVLSQDTCTAAYCTCTGRLANDMVLTSFSMAPAQPSSESSVSFSITALLDLDWGYLNEFSGVDVVLYVKGVPQTRNSYSLTSSAFSGLSASTSGPGQIQFTLSTGTWDRIGSDHLFFELDFYAPYSRDTLACIRTTPVDPQLTAKPIVVEQNAHA